MIIDVIEQRIKKMKELRHLELIKSNQAQQAVTDAKFCDIVDQVKCVSKAINYVSDNFGFVMSNVTQSDLISLLENLKKVARTEYADRDCVIKAKNDFKLLQTTIKKEWSKYYFAYTATTCNTLRVISGIDSEKVNGCIADIKAAENWSVDTTIFIAMKKAMESADSLIMSLNMDQEIIQFLSKMTSGKATIADLNGDVLSWIRKEKLESKIKLSFLSR